MATALPQPHRNEHAARMGIGYVCTHRQKDDQPTERQCVDVQAGALPMKPDEDRDQFEAHIDLAREPDFVLGALNVRPSLRQLDVNDRKIVIEPRVMQVLVVLARAEGVVISRDQLIQSCWEGRTVGDDAINRCIAKVRKLTKSDPVRSVSIETIRGVGYRLSVAAPDEPRSQRHLRLYAAISAIAAALFALAAWYWWPH